MNTYAALLDICFFGWNIKLWSKFCHTYIYLYSIYIKRRSNYMFWFKNFTNIFIIYIIVRQGATEKKKKNKLLKYTNVIKFCYNNSITERKILIVFSKYNNFHKNLGPFKRWALYGRPYRPPFGTDLISLAFNSDIYSCSSDFFSFFLSVGNNLIRFVRLR